MDEKASTKKKFLEIEVAKKVKGYKKGSSIKFDTFLPGIDVAVEQAKLFCEQPQELQHNIGTAMGKLIEEIKA